jgi:hypothetical protein
MGYFIPCSEVNVTPLRSFISCPGLLSEEFVYKFCIQVRLPQKQFMLFNLPHEIPTSAAPSFCSKHCFMLKPTNLQEVRQNAALEIISIRFLVFGMFSNKDV